MINLFLIILLKINFKKVILNIQKFSFVIIITFIFNFLLSDLKYALLISLKLLLVCNVTFIYTYKTGLLNIISALQVLLAPLKLIGISPQSIALIINIAITSIPIFIRDINQNLLVMKSKNLKIYSFKSLKYTSKIIFLSIFKKTNELELTLKSKNYIE